MKLQRVLFDGAILKRGFWLYVCKVTSGKKQVLYVGRTGDSSSIKAGSLFNRISKHLEMKGGAKSNSLYNNLLSAGLKPEECQFEFTGFGPLAEEQQELEAHRKQRDNAAGMEKALADYLEERGYKVIGAHPKVRSYDKALFAILTKQVDAIFPQINKK